MVEEYSKLSIEVRLKEREQPRRPVVMYQRWEELLFLHWAVDPKVLQATLPPGLQVDTYDERAWIGVVPFQMKGVRPRFLPAVTGLSDFPELNLRTYVYDKQGRPGVWFFSLDTPQAIANWIARRFFHLNYRMARFNLESKAEGIRYRSERHIGNSWDAPQDYNWSRKGDPCCAEPGSLEFFLAERYRLYAYDPHREKLLTGQIHHEPYPLQQVELNGYSKRLFELNDLQPPDGKPVSALASSGVDVEIFGMELVVF